jgi:hypothetical protein
MTLPVRLTSALRGDDQPGSLVARWIPDPHAASGLICTWVTRNGTEASASFGA